MKPEKTSIELAFEKAQAAKEIQKKERDKVLRQIEAWKRDTADPGYDEPIDHWLARRK